MAMVSLKYEKHADVLETKYKFHNSLVNYIATF